MSENILEKIINKKKLELEILKKEISKEELLKVIENNNKKNHYVNFKEKIQKNIINNKISIIAEIKKASPSAGVIIENYDPIEIAKTYNKNKVTCLSVLTEQNYFKGKASDLAKIKLANIGLPILCKDFFIDKFQIPLAKSYGADAILIILAGVSDDWPMNFMKKH